MESYSFHNLLILISIYLVFYCHVGVKSISFGTELIHPKSRLSPLRYPNRIESTIFQYDGGYLMKISIGSPAIERFAIMDTGSDLVWFQCAPCEDCYSQDTPIFDSKKSDTFKELSCQSKFCQDLPMAGGKRLCNKTSNRCKYSYGYADGTSTQGVLAIDTLSLETINGAVAAFPKLAFGCGQNNTAMPGSGLVGLGPGPLSLITQLGSLIDHKFSYCLSPDPNSPSKLKFGRDSIVSGKNVVSTPLLSKPSNIVYYVNLEGISINNRTLSNKIISRQGNTFIDSGSTRTFLESSLFDKVSSALDEVIGIKPVEDPQKQLKICYPNKQLMEVLQVKQINLVFHFTGADINVDVLNLLITRQSQDVVCFQFGPGQGQSIFGNTAQANLHVGFDLARKTISFAPSDCSKFN